MSIFAPIVAGNNARTNINVISSTNATESLEEMFQISQNLINSNRQVFGNYRLVKKEYITLNNINGIKIISTWRTNGIEIVGFQYILEKADTRYTITLTIRLSVDKREADIAESIIESFNSEPFDNPVQRSTSSATSSSNSSTPQQTLTTYTNQSRRFSIDYPRGWSVNPNAQAVGVQGVAFIAPENGFNFRTNFNVITSNRTESLDRLYQISQQQMTNNSNVFVNYRLEGKENVFINGISGIKYTASYRLGNYTVKGVQYILKKSDNTVYTITFTIRDTSYQSERNLVENIIQSFKSL